MQASRYRRKCRTKQRAKFAKQLRHLQSSDMLEAGRSPIVDSIENRRKQDGKMRLQPAFFAFFSNGYLSKQREYTNLTVLDRVKKLEHLIGNCGGKWDRWDNLLKYFAFTATGSSASRWRKL